MNNLVKRNFRYHFPNSYMRKRRFKYWIAIFFIILFLFKGITSVYPTLLNIGISKTISEKFFPLENDEENKTAEEKAGPETKPLYWNNDHQPGIAIVRFVLTIKRIQYHHIMYKQSVYISIPTPPPEIV